MSNTQIALDATGTKLNFDSNTFVIDESTNKIGIGTSTPVADLDIKDGHIKVGEEDIYQSDVDKPYLIVADDQYYTGETTSWGTYGMQHRIKTSSGGVPRLTIDSNAGELFSVAQNGHTIITNNGSNSALIDINSAGSNVAHDAGIRFQKEGSLKGFVGFNAGQQAIVLNHGGADKTDLVVKSGKVGINTSNPAHKFHIKGAETFDNGFVMENTAGSKIRQYFNNSTADSAYYISYDGTGGAEITIKADGDLALNASNGDNVGIGTVTPQSKLHLEQGNFRINNATNGFQVVEFAETNTVGSKIGYNFNNDSFTIRTVDGSGNLDTRVSVFGNTANSVLQIVNDGQSMLSLNNTANNGSQFRIISKVNGQKAGLLFRDEGHETDIMTLNEDGNVGIGSSQPSSKLHVEGIISSSGANLTMKDNSGNNITSASQSEGKITVTHNYHQVTHNAGDDTDDVRLHTIDGGVDGAILVLKQQSNDKFIKIMDGTGNLRLAGNGGHFQMNTGNDTITFVYSGSLWFEISRSDNA